MRSSFAAVLFGCARLAASEPIIGGQGDWRYEYQPQLLQVPISEVDNDKNGHGVTKDQDGNIYFTFVPKQVSSETQVLVKYSPNGSQAVMLGEPGPEGLSAGTPHGLRLEYDPVADASFLYHANNQQKVMKTTLDGEILWAADFSHWKSDRPEFWPIKPTDTVVVPGTDELLLADGYGSSYIHVLNKTTGEYLEGRSFGSAGSAGRFSTPHGISLDESRSPGVFAISDRSHNRLVWVNRLGELVDTKPTVPMPCNADVHTDETDGNVTLVTSLGLNKSPYANGSIAIYDSDAQLLSSIDVSGLIGNLGHQHPHDAIFLANGDIIVCCWSGPSVPGLGPSKGTISYWKRLPNDDNDVTAFTV